MNQERRSINADIREFGKFLTETSIIITIMLFAASSVVHEVIFRSWNLSFLQISSPTDVIMSGISLIFPSLVSILAASLFFVANIFYLYALDRDENDLSSKQKFTKGDIWHLLTVLFYTIFMAMAIFLGIFDIGELDKLPFLEWKLIFCAILISFALYGVWFSSYFDKKMKYPWSTRSIENREKRKIAEMKFDILVIGFVILTLCGGVRLGYIWLINIVRDKEENGFFKDHISVMLNGVDICKGGSRILWSGGEVLVVRCQNNQLTRFIVVRNAENLLLISN